MKNYFKFLSVAALAAAGLVGCSTSEVVPPDGEAPSVTPVTPVTPTGEPTYATFTVFEDNGIGTRVGEVTPSQGTELGTFTAIRLLIFDQLTGLLEKNVSIPTSTAENKSATVLVQSGTKRLFVIGNASAGIETRLAALPVGYTYDQFRDSVNLYDLAGGNGSAWVSGTPSARLKQTAAPATATLAAGIRELISTGGSFVVTNNLLETKYLNPKIDSVSSHDATGDIPDKNHFRIGVKRLVAKATVMYTGGTSGSPAGIYTTDRKGALTNLQYAYSNINRGVNLFEDELSVDGRPRAAYYDYAVHFGATPSVTADFIPYYWRLWDYNIIATSFGDLTSGALNPGAGGNESSLTGNAKYSYLTENDLNPGRDGGRSFVIAKGVYTPKLNIGTPGSPTYVADSIIGWFTGTYTPPAVGTPGTGEYPDANFNVTLGQWGKITKVAATAGTTFWRVNSAFGTASSITINDAGNTAIVSSFPNGTLFADSTLAYKVWWAATHSGSLSGFTLSGAYTAAKIATGSDQVQKYTGGVSYYRINIRHSGSTVNQEEYVKRNTAYQVGLKSFSQIGSPTIEDLYKNENREEVGPTYVTAEIFIIPWFDAVTNTDVDPYPALP